jgi:nitrate reductase gamma subunit
LGAHVVAGDRAQPPRKVAVGNELAQIQELVEGEQAGHAGVLGVVLLLGRATTSRDEVVA